MGKEADLCNEDKKRIAQHLLLNCSSELKVHRGKIQETAVKFGVCPRTVHRVWAKAKEQHSQGIPITFLSKKAGKVRSNNKHVDLEQIKDIPFSKRNTLRRLAKELQISKSHLGRMVKKGIIKPHTNAIKPELTPKNMLQMLNFSLHHITPDPQTQTLKFNLMDSVVHIDEKLFYMSRESERYYIIPGEIEPHRTCKSKRFITKVMFMCVVARPRFSVEGEVEFDGKRGIWTFTQADNAKTNSKNRLKGTVVTKAMDSITKEVTKACLLEKVIPAIKAKWPTNASKNIIIQQDNARPHIGDDDPDFRFAASSD